MLNLINDGTLKLYDKNDPAFNERVQTMQGWRSTHQVMVNHWPPHVIDPTKIAKTTVRVRQQVFEEPTKDFPSADLIAKVFMELEFVEAHPSDPATPPAQGHTGPIGMTGWRQGVPTKDPQVAGQLWNQNGTARMSRGKRG